MPNSQGNLFSAAGVGRSALAPLVLSYGMGVDSTAVLLLWSRTGVVPDLIMFADTGAERQSTYAYRNVIERFLREVGFPPLTVVNYAPRHGHYDSLLSDCLVKGMLPSLAYGGAGCSQKYKVQPQMAYLRTWPPALQAWSNGQKLRHAIGYDAGPIDMRRGQSAFDTELEEFVYPLREAGWDRDRCIREITDDPILSEIGRELRDLAHSAKKCVHHVPVLRWRGYVLKPRVIWL